MERAFWREGWIILPIRPRRREAGRAGEREFSAAAGGNRA